MCLFYSLIYWHVYLKFKTNRFLRQEKNTKTNIKIKKYEEKKKNAEKSKRKKENWNSNS